MHCSFVKTVRTKARENWGTEHKTQEEAVQKLLVPDAASAALLEIVRRINQAIDAWAKDVGGREDDEDDEDDTPPEYATKLPGVKVGDVLYSYETEGGLYRSIVTVVREDGYVRLVRADSEHRQLRLWWATEDDYRTEAEAMAAAAASEIAYYAPRLAWANRLLEATASGGDLSEFRGGMEEEDAEDE